MELTTTNTTTYTTTRTTTIDGKSEKISGKLILNEYDSSNLKNSKYDVETNELVVEFKKGGNTLMRMYPFLFLLK